MNVKQSAFPHPPTVAEDFVAVLNLDSCLHYRYLITLYQRLTL